MLITHLLVLVLLLLGETPALSVVVHVWSPCEFEWPPLLELFLLHKSLQLLFLSIHGNGMPCFSPGIDEILAFV